jgi:hypothetical protein
MKSIGLITLLLVITMVLTPIAAVSHTGPGQGEAPTISQKEPEKKSESETKTLRRIGQNRNSIKVLRRFRVRLKHGLSVNIVRGRFSAENSCILP